MGGEQKIETARTDGSSLVVRRTTLPAPTGLMGRFLGQLAELEPATHIHPRTIDENRLYRVYSEMKGNIEKEDTSTKTRLLLLLHSTNPDSVIETLRRQVLLGLLEDFLDEKIVAKAIRTEHIRKEFLFTFALNTEQEGRVVIKLAEPTCDVLRRISETHEKSYVRLREFLDYLPDDQRARFDLATAQYLDHGGKRYAYRIQYEGKNTVLVIAMASANEGNGAAFLPIMRKEADLYEIARQQPLKVLHVPDVFGVVGKLDDAGIVLTDITKGGNARLMCIQCNTDLIPQELVTDYYQDMGLLHRVMSDHGVRNFDIRAEGSVYVQRSLKDGLTRIYALDFENLVD
ncbi:Uncharacterised protein [Candidatus Bilamarchaeum dharawalense]|uniref:Uncharacterized protein n=1 Tax=Candidatus Bilamarchaeum dharawalense TaxID=2885759 RepID=A0A5E4LMJ3_9ARCH|nr:Uncharacterised protein [Candidatus Bilamarchaeum dharawalense]